MLPTRVLAALAVATAAAMPACAGGADEPPAWTVDEAEAIATVRGLPVRVRHCRGLGSSQGSEQRPRFRHFACVAGARNPNELFDTVAVHYELRPREEYEGPRSAHALARVRFLGGPGIP